MTHNARVEGRDAACEASALNAGLAGAVNTENDMDDKELIALEDAIKRLPNGDMVHTFRQGGPCLIGADHERDSLIEAMRSAPEIEVTGPQAQAMGHGLAIRDEHGWLFIATADVESIGEGGRSPTDSAGT